MAKSILTAVYSPLSGKVVPLADVPDPVFSGKILGDGVAIIPSDGRICSPVDGTLTTVAGETPARAATSRIVTAINRLLSYAYIYDIA